MTRPKIEGTPVGPGHTHWYVTEEGDICRSRWNDEAWCNHTGFNIRNLQPWQVHKLLNEAYQTGRREQQIIIQRALGVS